MPSPLDSFRALDPCPGDAVRWACVLEATAPKAGNVYPGRAFEDLRYIDFIAAAEITAEALSGCAGRLSERMLRAVEQSSRRSETNVNLGIVLLLGPLVDADRLLERDGATDRGGQDWSAAVQQVLAGFDGVDGQNLFRAIDAAAAGGLGQVDALDVRRTSGPVDIIKAMRLAESRDRIALQYAGGFADLIETVAPLLAESIARRGDLLLGIALAHLRLLSLHPDTLIARKHGEPMAIEVQKRAGSVDVDDPHSVARFDDWLRNSSQRLNPGTTADLIAAALYILLRTPSREK